ncbi:conjugal transfer protein [Stenoxybacter acetivorans]|uniref:VirB4 family type IV secretion/conjugal transfer ATPase n=1 Tax=Stenoxybacter acetivorans TaxID=422441 RepID=UPI00068A2AC1|nr:conjugal transfer protein [Stenoxybacter acetivorans]
MIISDFLRRILKIQPAQADFLPKISQHVTDHFVWYNTGHMMFVIKMEGLPFDGVDDNQLLTHFIGLQNLFTALGKSGDNRLALWATLQRQKIDFNRNYQFSNPFCRQFADKYLSRFAEKDYFENIFYLSVVLKSEDIKSGVKECEELSSMMLKSLEVYDPSLLGLYHVGGTRIDDGKEGTPPQYAALDYPLSFSEVYEFIGKLINTCRTPQPLTETAAYQVIGNADLHFGSDVFEIRPDHAPRKFAQAFDLKDFGISKPKILAPVLTLPFEFTLTQSLIFINSYDMQGKIHRQVNNLNSAGDKAHHQMAELEHAQGGLTAGEIMFGDYHAALIVYGKTAAEAAQNGSKATSAFLSSGAFRFTKSGFSAPSSYFSQVPGSRERPRSFPKTSINLATTFGIHNYSHGKKYGNPLGDGSAVMPMQTVSKTIFDFNFHFTKDGEDNRGHKIAGHTLILGATGTGKTTLQTSILAFAERFNPALFAMDLDRGMEIFIRGIGGSYFSLEAGKPTGLNPFQLPDTPKNRDFLYTLVGMCGADRDGKLTAAEEKEIVAAVDAVLVLDFELRNFSHLLQSIPIINDPNSLRVRLEKWCRSEGGQGGRFAWCLDNEKNLFNPDDFFRVGFDLTDILKDNYPPTGPVLAYMFHLRSLMMERIAADGGILATIIEEFWYAARFEALQEIMLKILKTDRKLGGWLVLVSQSPEDAIHCPVFPAIVQQTPTKIFLPNPDARYEGSYELCGLNSKEYSELVKLSVESRTFLVKQSKQSAFAMLDLYGFNDEMPFLSGSSETVELLHKIMAKHSNDVQQWYQPFVEAVRERTTSRKAKAKALI